MKYFFEVSLHSQNQNHFIMTKNIIFDLGGVVYDIRYENVRDAFLQMGATKLCSMYSKAQQTDFIDLYEEGKIPSSELRNHIRQMAEMNLSDAQIDEAWNAILIDVPENRVKFLLELKKKYKLYLFSNTNAICYDYFVPYLNNKFGCDFFGTIFEAAYFSHILHIRKPKEEGFRQILMEQNLNKEETLFIDDSPQHVEGALKCGLNAYHLKDGETIENLPFLK